ncbi:MAG: FAD-dependent oxidoreductase, partial [Bacteroidota bacterium]
KTKVDYIVVGLGIAGSWLTLELLKRDVNVIVIDQDIDRTSSHRAAGIYNPITGRKMVKTWRADSLFPHLEKHYQRIETLLSEKFLHPIPIYRPFSSVESRNDWEGFIEDTSYKTFLARMITDKIGYENIQDSFGGIILNHSGYVNIPLMLKAVKAMLVNKGIYREEVFDYSKMMLSENFVRYDDLQANKVFFCEGVIGSNPFWKLPFKPVRGEIIDIKCNLQPKHIINQGVFMIPKSGYLTVGSTYDHNNLGYEPQESGIQKLASRLSKLYLGSYEVIDKRAGVRPATHDRKPYIGLHYKYKTLGIFNGFGTKGVSLAPYFAKHLVDALQGKNEIDKEVDVKRVI